MKILTLKKIKLKKGHIMENLEPNNVIGPLLPPTPSVEEPTVNIPEPEIPQDLPQKPNELQTKVFVINEDGNWNDCGVG